MIITSPISADTSVVGNLTDVANAYTVVFKGRIVVDVANNLVRYPAMVVSRNGENFRSVSPGDYTVGGQTLTDFAVSSNSPGQNLYHYLDVSALSNTSANPVKTVSSASIPAPVANLVYLGMNSVYDYTPANGASFQSTRTSARLDSLAFQSNDILLDIKGVQAGDGVPVIYVPRILNYRIDGAASGVITVNNTASTELAAYVKFTLDLSVPNNISFDPVSNTYTNSTGVSPITPSGALSWISVCSYYRGATATMNGSRIVDLADVLAENQTNYGTTMVDLPRKSTLGSGAYVAVPLSALDSTSANILSGLGLVTGVSRSAGSAIITGDTVGSSIRGARIAARVYLYSSAGTWPSSVNLYAVDKDGNNIRNRAMTLESQLTSNLRSYTTYTDNAIDKDVVFISVGAPSGVSGTTLSLWGYQMYLGPRLVQGIWPAHYPTTATSTAVVAIPERANKGQQHRLFSKLSSIEQGATTVLLQVGLVADSFGARTIYAPRVKNRLQALYGSGGTGYLAFADNSGFPPNPSADDGTLPDGGSNRKYVVDSTAGSWSFNGSYSAPTANCAEAISGALNSVLRVTATGAQINTRAVLLYKPVSGSSVQYRWNGGAWTTVDTSSGYTAVMTGLPASGNWVLEIQDTGASGRCSLNGLNLRKASGVVFHKVACPGIRSTHFAAQAATAGFSAHWAELGVDHIVVSLGANDRVVSIPEATVAANYDVITAGIRAANPWTGDAPVGALYMPQCDNITTTNPFPMSVYTRVIYQNALNANAAFLNMDPFVDKSAAWFESDLAHPTTPVAGPAIARALIEMLDR